MIRRRERYLDLCASRAADEKLPRSHQSKGRGAEKGYPSPRLGYLITIPRTPAAFSSLQSSSLSLSLPPPLLSQLRAQSAAGRSDDAVHLCTQMIHRM